MMLKSTRIILIKLKACLFSFITKAALPSSSLFTSSSVCHHWTLEDQQPVSDSSGRLHVLLRGNICEPWQPFVHLMNKTNTERKRRIPWCFCNKMRHEEKKNTKTNVRKRDFRNTHLCKHTHTKKKPEAIWGLFRKRPSHPAGKQTEQNQAFNLTGRE